METLPLRVDSVLAQERENRWTMLSGYLAVVGAGLVIGLVGFERLGGTFALALAALACVAVAILLRPIAGVYLTVFFSVVGDGSTMGGYPFNFNFSSTRSFLYITNALTFSPLELCLALTVVSWFVHAPALARGRCAASLCDGRCWPSPAWSCSASLYGVGVGGGDITVAMWELRPLLYLVAMYLLASTLFTRSSHYVSLAWVIIAGDLGPERVRAQATTSRSSAAERDALEALTEHTASLLYNYVFLLALAPVRAAQVFAAGARSLLLVASIPTVYVFVLSQRRAAFVALVAGFIVLALVLCFRRRRLFFVVVPVVLLLIAGYTVAFWNATEGVGFGAAAIKSVVAPGSLSEKDAVVGPLSPDRELQPGGDHQRRAVDRRRVRQAVLAAGAASRHQLLRVRRVHPAQLDPVDLAEDGIPRLRGAAVHHRRRACERASAPHCGCPRVTPWRSPSPRSPSS